MGRSRIRTRDAVIIGIIAFIIGLFLGYAWGFGAAINVAARAAQKYVNVTISEDVMRMILMKYGSA